MDKKQTFRILQWNDSCLPKAHATTTCTGCNQFTTYACWFNGNSTSELEVAICLPIPDSYWFKILVLPDAYPDANYEKPGIQRVHTCTRWYLRLPIRATLCCHSNKTCAPIANLPNNGQLGGTRYHSPSYIWVRAVVWECGEEQTHSCVWPIYISRRLRLTQNVITKRTLFFLHSITDHRAQGSQYQLSNGSGLLC